MGVLKKNRRTIICDNKKYIWYVAEDCDSSNILLNIISEDKSLVLTYTLYENYIVSKGRIFQGNKTSGRWERYLLPISSPVITPKFVSEIITWANGESNAVKLKFDEKRFMY